MNGGDALELIIWVSKQYIDTEAQSEKHDVIIMKNYCIIIIVSQTNKIHKSISDFKIKVFKYSLLLYI